MDLVTEINKHLVNRRDIYGLHNGRQWVAKNANVNDELLRAHFNGEIVIGLYTTSPDQTSRWACWDFDAHDELDTENWVHVQSLAENLTLQGMHPIIEDSNGAGGFHVWIIFDEPLPTYAVFDWMNAVPVNYRVERFPKQRRTESYGNFVRLPGKHPKREHFSKFFDGDEWTTDFLSVFEVTDHTLVEVRLEEHQGDIPPLAAQGYPTAQRIKDFTEGTDEDNFLECRSLLQRLPPDKVDQYDQWLKVGMILHRYEPSRYGLRVWDQWSRQSQTKYEYGACEAKWRTFKHKEEGVSVGTLRHWVNQNEKKAVEPFGAEPDTILESISNALGIPLKSFRRLGTEAGQVSYYIETGGDMVRIGNGQTIDSQTKFRVAVMESLGKRIPKFSNDDWDQMVKRFCQVCEDMPIEEDTIVGNFRAMLEDYRADKKVPVFPLEMDEDQKREFTRTVKAKDPFVRAGLFHLSMSGFKRWLAMNQIPPLVEPNKTLRLCGWQPVNIVTDKIGRRYHAAEEGNTLLLSKNVY